MLFLKVITYDQSFTFDATKTVTVYLPYERRSAVSYEQYRETQKFFDKNKQLTVEGARVRLIAFPPMRLTPASSERSLRLRHTAGDQSGRRFYDEAIE